MFCCNLCNKVPRSKIGCGMLLAARSIFYFPPLHAFVCKRPCTSHKLNTILSVTMSSRTHRVSWEPWQSTLELPDTEPGAPGLNDFKFACYRCATILVKGDQIARFGDPGSSGTTNCVWTKSTGLLDTVVPNEKENYNDVKETYVQGISCRNCKLKIGSFYKSYKRPEDGIVGPCCKLTHWRKNKRSERFQHMVVVGDQKTVIKNLAEAGKWVPEDVSEDVSLEDAEREIAALEKELRGL